MTCSKLARATMPMRRLVEEKSAVVGVPVLITVWLA